MAAIAASTDPAAPSAAAPAATEAPPASVASPSIYQSGEPLPDYVRVYVQEHPEGSSTAKQRSARINPVALVATTVAAPLYLYTQYKGTADLWEKLLTSVPQEVLTEVTLDAGCQRGVALMKIAERKKDLASQGVAVAPAYGMDAFEQDQPHETAENAVALGVESLVVVNKSDGSNPFPYKTGSFGLVTCSLSLALWSPKSRKHAVSEIARVCRPGGRLIIVTRKGYGHGIKDTLAAAGWSEKLMDVSWAGAGVMFGMWPGEVLTAQCPLTPMAGAAQMSEVVSDERYGI